MGVITIGPTVQPFPTQALPAIVQLKRTWSDPWLTVPALEFLGGHVSTAGHDLGAATLLHRFGVLKHPWEATDSLKWPATLNGCWVRVGFVGQQGLQEAWIGRITGEGRNILGSTESVYGSIPCGAQHFEALGPLHILRRIHLSRSVWDIDGTLSVIEWLPSLNERYGRTDKPLATKGRALGTGPGAKALGSKSGNRSASKHDGVYVYGGTELWNYRQYAEYLLWHFADESDTGGPTWTLGGQADVLEYFADPIVFGTTQSVDQVLRALIRPELGVDFKIVSTQSGFEVSVFVLTHQSCGWGGHVLPGNPDLVQVRSSRTKDSIQTTVVRSSDERYATIRVLGARIVVCGSLERTPPDDGDPTLGYTWDSATAAAYEAGTGNSEDSAKQHDAARQAEKFRDVLRRWVAADHWFTAANVWRAPYWDGRGNPIEQNGRGVPDNGPLQRRLRSTLPWLPLQAGVDYSVETPVQSDAELDYLLPPQAWISEGPADPAKPEETIFYPVDTQNIGLAVLPDDFGIFLHTHTNHILAKGYWDLARPSEVSPKWHPDWIVATLAYTTDQRMYCEQAVAGAAPCDGVLEIEADECQLWWLAPNTVLSTDHRTDKRGRLVRSPNNTAGLILRNDWARLSAKMAGALARHYQDRLRAQFVVRGLVPWGALVGKILIEMDAGGDVQQIAAPITEVRWQNGENPTTTISTGFAGGD
ncbi:MAG: hypothetical protein WC107_06225 [Patescibacteria group bacterium]